MPEWPKLILEISNPNGFSKFWNISSNYFKGKQIGTDAAKNLICFEYAAEQFKNKNQFFSRAKFL